jgi:hypothetical protein
MAAAVVIVVALSMLEIYLQVLSAVVVIVVAR